MPPLPILKAIGPVLPALGFLILLLPTASAQLALSSTEAQAGDTITFSGSIHSMSCSGTNAGFRVLLKKPGGGYFISDAVSFSNQKYTNQEPGGANCTTKNGIMFPGAPVIDVGYAFEGSVQTGEDWPAGEYEIVIDSPYECRYYICNEVKWRSDAIETARFRISGSGPEDNVWQIGSDSVTPPVGRQGTYTKTFTMNELAQTSLMVSAHQSATCYVNGQRVASGISSQMMTDITPYLVTCQNTVRCDVGAGYERVCTSNYGDCGCSCWARSSLCGGGAYFWSCTGGAFCRDVKFRGTVCYVPAAPSFDARVSVLANDEISWSNDNANWYYGELPMQSDSWWLEKPNYYESFETTYTGIHPWSGSQLYVKKWLFKEDAPEGMTQWLKLSSTSDPDCTLNGQPLQLSDNIHEWWLYKADVTNLPDQLELECTVPKNEQFNIFDVELVQASPITVTLLTKETVAGQSEITAELSTAGEKDTTLYIELYQNGELLSGAEERFLLSAMATKTLVLDTEGLEPGQYALLLTAIDEDNGLSYQSAWGLGLLPALPPEPPGTPFSFDSGSAGSSPSGAAQLASWVGQSVGGITGAASSIPAAPLAGAAAAVAAVGAASHLLSRRRFTGTKGRTASYWSKVSALGQKYREKLESIRKKDEDWKKFSESLERKWAAERKQRDAKSLLSRIVGASSQTISVLAGKGSRLPYSQQVKSLTDSQLAEWVRKGGVPGHWALKEIEARKSGLQRQYSLLATIEKGNKFQKDLAEIQSRNHTDPITSWIRDIEKEAVFSDDPNSLGSKLSVYGSMAKEIGSTVGLAGLAMLGAGAASALTGIGALVGIPLAATGGYVSLVGYTTYVAGYTTKSIGDYYQTQSCNNEKCFKAGEKRGTLGAIEGIINIITLGIASRIAPHFEKHIGPILSRNKYIKSLLNGASFPEGEIENTAIKISAPSFKTGKEFGIGPGIGREIENGIIERIRIDNHPPFGKHINYEHIIKIGRKGDTLVNVHIPI